MPNDKKQQAKNRRPLVLRHSMAIMLDDDLHTALQSLSDASGLSMGRLIRRACANWLTTNDAKSLRASGEQEAQHRTLLQGVATSVNEMIKEAIAKDAKS